MIARARRALGGVLLLAAGVAAQDELRLQIRCPIPVIEFGRAFTIEVERAWRTDLEPEPWRDAVLSPLVVVTEDVALRTEGSHSVETRRLRAHAFVRDAVIVPAPSFRARDRAGREFVATTTALELVVQSALPDGAPSAPELPGGLLPLPRSPWDRPLRIAFGVAALVGLAAATKLLVARARRRPVAPARPPFERAMARLGSLQGAAMMDAAAREGAWTALATTLRDWFGARYRIAAGDRTSDELLALLDAKRVLSPPARQALAAILARCDLVKFARHAPDAAAWHDAIEDAQQLVIATRSLPQEAAP
ncbi:MAG: hypothetical protein IT457_08125 [Planctomycetes bacterium]|nr:hypothetical protein [Planctomycetota bacterium]